MLVDGDGVAAVAQYRQLQKEHPDIYDFDENSINNLGYWLMVHQRLGDAVAIFKLNVEEHPESWNVFDSYGEALLAGGDTTQSIQHYKKSLELNPDNDNAMNVLSGLGIE